jgi:sulfite reductase (NADPH) flavoprotein alpha-component
MPDVPETPAYSKDNPFPALITENRLLTRPGSAKQTRHFAVNIAGSGLHYACGDSLGVFPTNRAAEVDEVLLHLRASGEEMVTLPRNPAPLPLREALAGKLALAGPTRRIVETLAAKAADPGEKARLDALLAPEAKEALESFLDAREFVDLLHEFPSARLQAQEFVDHLRRLTPRLYSIASSPALTPEEVHLTVAVVQYHSNNRHRFGVASNYLAGTEKAGTAHVPVFIAESHFGLPDDPSRDLIMVGPGTGVAPFRAFLQERVATGATGRNWLFFGDQHRATDFLYEEEWEALLSSGKLARLDTAFSRDQEKKVYVQDRMRENGAQLWQWLRGGAAFMVCGDAKRMAKDVDAALHEIVAIHAPMGAPEAAEYVRQMKKEKRYQRDVY